MARKGHIVIRRERCKGCWLCIRACPLQVLEADTELNQGGSYPCKPVRLEKCIACGNCREVCPDVCIEIYDLNVH